MGLREWILKPYLDKLQALEQEVKALDARLQALDDVSRKVDVMEERLKVMENEVRTLRDDLKDVLKALNDKANKDDLKDLRIRLNSLEKALDNIITRMEAQEIILKGEEILSDKEAQKELVLKLIREGYNQPSRILEMVPFGAKRLYEILDELEKNLLIKKIKKKRKVYYIAEEEAY